MATPRTPKASPARAHSTAAPAGLLGLGGAPGEEAAALLDAMRAPLADEMSLFAYRGFLAPLMAGPLTFSIPSDPGAADGERLEFVIFAPSTFLAEWVRAHYGQALAERAALVLGRPASSVDVRFVERPADTKPPTMATPEAGSSSSSAAPAADRAPSAPPAPRSERVVPLAQRGRAGASAPGRRLDPRYTFDTFVTGAASRMAYSAAMNVAERPGARYSPLFIFGPTGLGKTHLLHAVGHEILSRHPQQRVALLSAEQWVNEFIESAHDKAFEAFRRRFRDDVDVLLVDDIQFLAGKHQSQDEFFHTFNALYEAHKQIVVTSDRYPHEIAGLEDRLKTRLQWGLVTDVRPPDAETRRQIVMRKAIEHGCALPMDVVEFVAASVTTSVRALEGALTRLVAWSQLTREPVSLAEAKEQLRPTLTAGAQSPLSVGRIIDVVATYHGMRAKDLTGPSRQRQVTRARQLAMFLAREHLQLSFPELGRAFGGRDHTTALASIQKIQALRTEEASVQAVLAKLEQALF